VEADANATNAVTCTIPSFGSVACVLFHLGATHSFGSSAFVKLCKMSTKPLEYHVNVWDFLRLEF
jgi:hypothetical protein